MSTKTIWWDDRERRAVVKHNPAYGRRPFAVFVEHEFVGWRTDHVRRFKTREKAEAWAARWYAARKWKNVSEGSR